MSNRNYLDIIDDKVDAPDRKPLPDFHVWKGIMLHHTGIGRRKFISDGLWRRLNKGIVNWLSTKDKFYVSAHFQIGRFGELTELVDPDLYIAFHAGKSRWWDSIDRKFISSLNNSFIGIELVGDGNIHKYTDKQYYKAALLCNRLKNKFPTIQSNMIIGHDMASPGRKVDPGHLFDWEIFYRTYWRIRNENNNNSNN